MQNIEEIYKEYFNTVNKYLFCLTQNSDIAEELTQETFLRAVKKINTYNNECKMSTWLCQIAKHLWYDQCRKKNKNISIEDVEIAILENIEDDTIKKEEKILLYTKIQKLEEPMRTVMYLRLTGELSFKEIGIILNKSENWARVNFYRGKNKLKESD